MGMYSLYPFRDAAHPKSIHKERIHQLLPKRMAIDRVSALK